MVSAILLEAKIGDTATDTSARFAAVHHRISFIHTVTFDPTISKIYILKKNQKVKMQMTRYKTGSVLCSLALLIYVQRSHMQFDER